MVLMTDSLRSVEYSIRPAKWFRCLHFLPPPLLREGRRRIRESLSFAPLPLTLPARVVISYVAPSMTSEIVLVLPLSPSQDMINNTLL